MRRPDQKIEDQHRENQMRLRAEVNIFAAKLRKQVLNMYKEEWAEALSQGVVLIVRGEPDEIKAMALRAISTFADEQITSGK